MIMVMKKYNIYSVLALAIILFATSCVKSDYDKPERPLPPTPDKATQYVNETFDEVSKVDGQMLMLPEGWTNVAVSGNRVFQTGTLARLGGGVERGVMGSGYLSADTVNDFWLIMPPLNVSDSTSRLSFEIGLTYENASTKLMVMYSDTYVGGDNPIDPSLWQLLGDFPPGATESGPVQMKKFENISLYGLGGARKVAYVAFRYRSVVTLRSISTDDAKRANYYLDNIEYRRQ